MRKVLFYVVLAVIAYGALVVKCETLAQGATKPTISQLRAEYNKAAEAVIPIGKCYGRFSKNEASRWVPCSRKERAAQIEAQFQRDVISKLAGQDVAKANPPKSDKKPEVDPLELTQAELADAGAILNEFKTLQEKLGTAQEDLFKAYDKGKDAFDAAAKDNYIVISKIKDVQARYRAWEAPVKERIKCPDCTFNTQTGKMVRPQPSPKQ